MVSYNVINLANHQIARLRAQVTVSESQKESLVQQIIVTLTPTIRSAVHTAMQSQASARLNSLVSQVMVHSTRYMCTVHITGFVPGVHP